MAVRRRASRRACTRRPTAGAACSIWGMGIASYDLTGDGYPRCTSPARAQQAPDARRGSGPAGLPRHGARRAASTRDRPFVGGDPLPSTAWHPEFQDVNNDGFMDLFVTKGNVNADPRLRDARPEQPVPRPARRHVRRGLRRGRHRLFDRGRGRRARRLQPRRAARPRGRQPRDARRSCGATSAAATADAPAPMGGWLGVRLHQPGTEPRCHRRHRRDARRRPRAAARARRSAAATPAASSAGPTSGSAPPTNAEVRSPGRTARSGPWMTLAANRFVDIERGATGRRAVDAAGPVSGRR